jgi:hypothetical protein
MIDPENTASPGFRVAGNDSPVSGLIHFYRVTLQQARIRRHDGKVRPMPGYCRKDHGRFDHSRNGAPKIAEELQERIGLLFFNLIRPILGQPLLRLGLTEAVRRTIPTSPAVPAWEGISDRPSHCASMRKPWAGRH